jgi:hypothetical protein
MVDKYSLAYAGARMDLNPGKKTVKLGQEPGNKF